MSGTDYAAELLGGAKGAAPVPTLTAAIEARQPPPTDYASELLGGRTMEPSVMRPVEAESTGAPFGTMVKSSMVDNPETKMRIYAKSRFPKLAEKDALDRYGVIGGEIVYLDDDGKIKRESPSGVGGFFKELGANMIGQAGSVIGGTAGAIAGAPAGPAGAAGGAALGAAGGKGYNQVIANLLFDEPQTVGGNVKGMAVEGGMSAGTTYLGSKLAQKIGERALARDISKLDRPQAEALQQKGRDIGVDLNAAQTTNLPSLKGRYEVLGRMEPSMDIIDASRRRQGEQAIQAVDDFLAKLSPVDNVDEAGTLGRNAARQVILKLTAERAGQAAPLYKQAFSEFNGIPAELLPRAKDLMSRPSMQEAGKTATRIAADEGIDLTQPANSLLGMHYMKLALDKAIGDEARGSLSATSRSALIGLKNELLDVMDNLSPTYAKARGIYSHMSPNIDSVKEGVISKVGKLGDEQAFKAGEIMFGNNMSPAAISRARNLFEKAGLQEDWHAMLRSFLQKSFETAGTEYKSGAGGMLAQAPAWRAMMMGNPQQRARLMAGLDPKTGQGFEDMMAVFEAMGRVTGQGGSPTYPLSEAGAMLRREVGSGPFGFLSTVFAPQTWGPKIDKWLTEARLGKHAAEMANVMTSPDGLQTLKQLRQIPVTDKRFFAGFSSLFGIGKQTDETPQDRPIGARLQQQGAKQ